MKRDGRSANIGGEGDVTEAATVSTVMWAVKTTFVLNVS